MKGHDSDLVVVVGEMQPADLLINASVKRSPVKPDDHYIRIRSKSNSAVGPYHLSHSSPNEPTPGSDAIDWTSEVTAGREVAKTKTKKKKKTELEVSKFARGKEAGWFQSKNWKLFAGVKRDKLVLIQKLWKW